VKKKIYLSKGDAVKKPGEKKKKRPSKVAPKPAPKGREGEKEKASFPHEREKKKKEIVHQDIAGEKGGKEKEGLSFPTAEWKKKKQGKPPESSLAQRREKKRGGGGETRYCFIAFRGGEVTGGKEKKRSKKNAISEHGWRKKGKKKGNTLAARPSGMG